MCGPIFDAASSYSSSKAQKQGLRAESTIARENAALAEQQGRNEIDLGRGQIEQLQQQGAQFESTQKNIMADNGIDISTGSAIDILASTRQQVAADTNTLRANAALSAWGHRVNATNLTNQANMASASAKNISPLRNAVMTLGKSAMGEAKQDGGIANTVAKYKTLLGA